MFTVIITSIDANTFQYEHAGLVETRARFYEARVTIGQHVRAEQLDDTNEHDDLFNSIHYSVIQVDGVTPTSADNAVALLNAVITPSTGGVGGASNLGYTASATGGIVTNDAGTNATLPLATATNAGLAPPELSGLFVKYADAAARLAETGHTVTQDEIDANILFLQDDDNTIWVPTGTAGSVVWEAYGGGGSDTSLSDTDQTLDGARLVSLNGNDLTFSGLGAESIVNNNYLNYDLQVFGVVSFSGDAAVQFDSLSGVYQITTPPPTDETLDQAIVRDPVTGRLNLRTLVARSFIKTQVGHGLTLPAHGFIPVIIDDTTFDVSAADAATDATVHDAYVTAINGDDLTIQFDGLLNITGVGATFPDVAYLQDGGGVGTSAGTVSAPVSNTLSNDWIALYEPMGFQSNSTESDPSLVYYFEGAFDQLDPTNADDDFEQFILDNAISASNYHLNGIDPTNEFDPEGFRSGSTVTLPANRVFDVTYRVYHPSDPISGGAGNIQGGLGAFRGKLGISASPQGALVIDSIDDSRTSAPEFAMIERKVSHDSDVDLTFAFSADADQGAGDFEDFYIIIEVREKAKEKTVINTTDTPVDDQTASGYMDIGNMRMQWGVQSGVAGGNNTLTFPVPFGVAPVLNTNVTGSSNRFSSHAGVSTTGATVYVRSNAGSGEPQSFHWQAIGLKP